MADSIGYQWFILLFTLAILVVCIINAINYSEIKSNFEAYKVTLAFTADPNGTPATPISPSPLNIGAGKPYVNGDLVSVTNASLTGFQRGSFNVTMATYDINTGEATFTNAVNVNGTTFGPSTYNIAPTVNPDGMSEGSILAGLWINIILAILSGLFFIWRVILFFKTPEDIAAATVDKFGKQFEPIKFKTREEKGDILADKVKLILDNAGLNTASDEVSKNVRNKYVNNKNISESQAVLSGAESVIGENNAAILANNFKTFSFARSTNLEKAAKIAGNSAAQAVTAVGGSNTQANTARNRAINDVLQNGENPINAAGNAASTVAGQGAGNIAANTAGGQLDDLFGGGTNSGQLNSEMRQLVDFFGGGTNSGQLNSDLLQFNPNNSPDLGIR